MLRTYAEKSDCGFHLFRLRPKALAWCVFRKLHNRTHSRVFLRSLQFDFAISVWLLDTFGALLRGTVYDDQSFASIVVGALPGSLFRLLSLRLHSGFLSFICLITHNPAIANHNYTVLPALVAARTRLSYRIDGARVRSMRSTPGDEEANRLLCAPRML